MVKAPDRTIDFIFASKNVKIGPHHVRQSDTRKISDHFPVVAEIELKK
ncbi:MAG: endonuclease/exonuclease/phosphatase family protein [Spirochaetota bacterium]